MKKICCNTAFLYLCSSPCQIFCRSITPADHFSRNI